ncbi:MAG: metallophosphoesterase [Ignisphaera sp.]|uniref:Phosphoesterase n=1 Tax=Ignisphaera aggregans TaxID=334771 RepID=A0A7C4H781_9CREN
MLIGVMSDSHDNIVAIEKALNIFRKEDIDVLIHLGDIISPFAFAKILEFPAKILVVLGNNDGDIVQLKEMAIKGGAILKQFMFATSIENKQILLVHGYGSKDYTKNIVYSLASTGHYNIILYGHTHEVDVLSRDSILVLNPGEVCGYITGRQSVAIIDIDTMKFNIIDL